MMYARIYVNTCMCIHVWNISKGYQKRYCKSLVSSANIIGSNLAGMKGKSFT